MRERVTAERRQVTIVHVDIVNSTALVDHLDPEELMGIMQTYLNNCRAIVAEFQGTLAGYTGDGFEAYFGYPVAREDSAIDALNAAIQFTRMLAGRDRQLPFNCRIGIATGRVVVDQPGIQGVGRNLLAFGATPTLANRLEQLADPGSILIDNATMKLCEGRFAFRSLGPLRLKGFDKDFDVWEVIESLRPGRRFMKSGQSPYIGRNAEMQLLMNRWKSVLAREGQVVVLHGEPGIGKSRLVHEFQRSLSKNSVSISQFQCLDLFTSTPLHPWVHSVQRFASIQQNDGAENKLTKIADYLGRKLGFSQDTIAICASLMGLAPTYAAHPGEHSLGQMTRLLGVLVDYLISSSRNAPVFVLIEDIQWIDASTMNLIQSLVEDMVKERIMVVMTCRSGSVPSFNYPHVTSLSLSKLDSISVMNLISEITLSSQHTLSENVSSNICQRSDGNPLFVEELTKHYMELSTTDLDSAIAQRDHLVPNVLQGSLMERIDNAGRCKEIAQLASVIGKEFDNDIMVDLSEYDPKIVQQQLDELTGLRILHRLKYGNRISYDFSHALLRDAVYSSLLKPTRTRTHRKIAEYFERDQGALQHVPSEIIAYHYECSDDQENAFHHWVAAGQHALLTGATEEAAGLFAKALKSAADIGETPDNLEDLAKTYLSCGLALNASRGAAANPIFYFRRAEELSTKLGFTELTLEALDWQFGLHFNAGELLSSKLPAQKMKHLGSSLKHRMAIAGGCQGLGMFHFMLGNFLEAREEFELGLNAGGESISGEHCYPSMSLSYLAWTYFVLGHSAEAKSYADRAIKSARQESSHALATALSNCCYVYQCMASIDKIYECTQELVEHTKKYGEQMYFRRGRIMLSWANYVAGRGKKSIQTISEEVDFLLRSNEQIETTYLLSVLADLQIQDGRFGDAHTSLNRALDIASHNQENFYLAEIYRLKAKLVEIDPGKFSAICGTDYLAMARSTAEKQHAKAWLDRFSNHGFKDTN